MVAPGPVVKLAITRSSSDSVKASMKPASTAGRISGNVTVRKARNGGQPRSIAASSRLQSKDNSRDCTITRDEAHGQRRMRHRIVGPEAAFDIGGDEQQQQRKTDDDFRHHQRRIDHRRELAIGRESVPCAPAPSAASVPRMVASDADRNAMRRLTQAACRIAESSKSARVPAQRPAAPDRDQL